MNPLRDRSPLRDDEHGRGSFGSNSRPNFGRVGPNNRLNDTDERSSYWANGNSFLDNRCPSSGGLYDHRDSSMDSRNFTSEEDIYPPGCVNLPPPVNENIRNDATSSSVSSLPVSQNQRTNDVEIIITHKSSTTYAESIERRLKTSGLSVDLLFPSEEASLGRILSNIASRGTLFALVVTEFSEECKSAIVNVLINPIPEFRDMPLDDAITAIVKHYEAYSKGERSAIGTSETESNTEEAKHPEGIQYSLNVLVENRPLNYPQYEKLIAYLQTKKNRCFGRRFDTTILSKSSDQDKKMQLQNRILSILTSSKSKTAPNPSHLKDSPTIKALQTIVQNNLLGSRM